MKLRHHVSRISSESAELPHNLPPRVSIWLLAFFGAGMGPLVFATVGTAATAFNPHGELPVAEAAFNWLQVLAFLSALFAQGFALGGLAARRDWGRGMAVITCLIWSCWLVGVIPAVVVVVVLYRWKYNDTSREAEAPAWLTWIFAAVCILLVAGWAIFMAWIRQTVLTTTAAQGHALDLLPILLIATLIVLAPILVLQVAALYGLTSRRHWGREAATAAALVWAFTIVGIPLTWAAIRTLWPRAVPVVAPAPA